MKCDTVKLKAALYLHHSFLRPLFCLHGTGLFYMHRERDSSNGGVVGYLIQVLGEELEGFVKGKNQSKLKDNDEHSF